MGLSFIVLFILGYVPHVLLIIGMLLVAIDSYMFHSHHKELLLLRKDILALGGLLVYIYSDETEEDVNGL
jgi:hypothetical protein